MNDGSFSPQRPPMNAADGPFTDHLSPEDQAALDALIDAGFDPSAVPQPLQPAATRLAAVMGLLGVTPGQAHDSARAAALAEGMVDATLARVRLADARAARGDDAIEPALSDNDHDALEALISAGYDSDEVTQVLRRRARRHEDLLNLLNPASTEWRGDGQLVSRTLNHVQSSIESEQKRLALPMAEDAVPMGRRFRLADLVTVAALLLIGVFSFINGAP